MIEFKNIFPQLHYIPQAALLTVLFMMSYLFIKENKGHAREKIASLFSQKWLVAFLFYTALLLTGTIIARTHTEPFRNIIGIFGFTTYGGINKNGLINILLFVPYTFLYIKAFGPQRPFGKSLLLSLATTLFIEFFQLLFWVGWFSFADIIHNITGGIIGYLLWIIPKTIKEKQLFRRALK